VNGLRSTNEDSNISRAESVDVQAAQRNVIGGSGVNNDMVPETAVAAVPASQEMVTAEKITNNPVA
jgi:hypothetical protein